MPKIPWTPPPRPPRMTEAPIPIKRVRIVPCGACGGLGFRFKYALGSYSKHPCPVCRGKGDVLNLESGV